MLIGSTPIATPQTSTSTIADTLHSAIRMPSSSPHSATGIQAYREPKARRVTRVTLARRGSKEREGREAGPAFEGRRGRQGHGEQPAPEGQQGLRVETGRMAGTEPMAMMDGMVRMVLQDPGVRRGLEAGPASGGRRDLRGLEDRRDRVGRQAPAAAAMTRAKDKTE